MKAKALILMADGINCETELAYSFRKAGAEADIVHLNTILMGRDPILNKNFEMDDYNIFAIPGGFSYGDYLGAGKILGYQHRSDLGEKLEQFISDGKLVIGICNGFQTLVKSVFLPDSNSAKQEVSLTYNDSGRFIDSWVRLAIPDNKCVWTKGIEEIYLPVAHGEGKFIAEEAVISKLASNSQIVFQYADKKGNPTSEYPYNPNGSMAAIAGICDPTGKILGLMPHPERYHSLQNNPDYYKKKHSGTENYETTGLSIFKNAVEYLR